MNFFTRAKIVGLCLFMLAAFGCGLHGHGGGGGTGDKADANPVDAVTRSINAQTNAKSYRMRMEMSIEGRNFASTVEYVAPDRYHMTSLPSGSILGNETIIVGPATYTKTGSGPWQKSPVDMAKMVAAFRDPKILENLRKGMEVKFIGTDTLDGTPVRIYQYTQTNPAGLEGKAVTKAYISNADDLPLKMEIEAEPMQGSKSKTTMLYSDYNGAIKIEPPM